MRLTAKTPPKITSYPLNWPRDNRSKVIDRDDTARAWFKNIWNDINGKESLDANPWVWVIEFERIKQ